eukprot:m.94886 g.94886  ORF g.94886 m.94886 type:complete len:222 (-) comp26763_c1_seq1:88-753(-)
MHAAIDDSEVERDPRSLKLVVVGDSGVGKTSLLHLICEGKPLREAEWTVGSSVQVLLWDPPNSDTRDESSVYSMEFWDVGGSARYQQTRSVFWSDPPDGIVLVYDLSNRKSCDTLTQWHSEVIKGHNDAMLTSTEEYDPETIAGIYRPLTMVVGTKLDCVDASTVPKRLPLASDLGAGFTVINSLDAAALQPGSDPHKELNMFYERLVGRKEQKRVLNTRR